MLNWGGTYGSLCLCVQSRKICKVLFVCKSLRNEFIDFFLILHKDVGVGLPIKVYEYNTVLQFGESAALKWWMRNIFLFLICCLSYKEGNSIYSTFFTLIHLRIINTVCETQLLIGFTNKE